MYSDWKADEIIVDILKTISNGSPITLKSYAKPNSNYSKDTIKKHLNDVRFFFDAEFYYDDRDKVWKAAQQKFLEYSALSAEEAVILAGIRKNSDHYGYSLRNTVLSLVNFVTRRRHTSKLQNYTVENFKHFQKNIRKIDNAITKRQYVNITYRSKGELKEKTVMPLRISNVEYYWYFIAIPQGETDTNSIRYYALYNIETLEISDQVYDSNMQRRYHNEVKNAHKGMNAYYKPYLKHKYITVLVPDNFMHYIKRSPYFLLFERKETPPIVFEIEEDGSKKYEYHAFAMPSTDEEYNDIIPTIQKYAPQIIVPDIEENKELLSFLSKRHDKHKRHEDIISSIMKK